MAPISRRSPKKYTGRRSFQKRVKPLSRIQKPCGKQRKMTDFFPPSPRPTTNKDSSGNTTVSSENEAPPANYNATNKINISPQRYGLRPKKIQPRVFYGFEPEKQISIQTKDIKIKKQVAILKENNVNIPQIKNDDLPNNIDQIATLMKVTNIDSDNKITSDVKDTDKDSPSKCSIENIYKPQRNARRIYLKYGSRIPSFIDILKSRDELIKFKEGVASVAELQNAPLPQYDKCNFILEPEGKEISQRLNCKHIPLDDLKSLFVGYADFVVGIGNGSIPSDRHTLYMQDPFGGSEFNRGDLTFNISMSSFTTKQKVLLAKLTKKAFCAGKLMFNNQYYFKVVLPELCLKLFMQEHKLTESEATKYLTNSLQT